MEYKDYMLKLTCSHIILSQISSIWTMEVMKKIMLINFTKGMQITECRTSAHDGFNSVAPAMQRPSIIIYQVKTTKLKFYNKHQKSNPKQIKSNIGTKQIYYIARIKFITTEYIVHNSYRKD